MMLNDVLVFIFFNALFCCSLFFDGIMKALPFRDAAALFRCNS